MIDIKTLREDFDKIIKYSQGYPADWEIDSTKILEQWLTAKSSFINVFGGPIKEIGPFELTCSTDWKIHTFGSFLNSLRYDYSIRMEALDNFLEKNRIGFFDNKVVEEFKVNDTIIPKGMKIVKALKYFINNEEVLASIQNYASELIQKSKISGILCFSVHPFDFLSSSENTHNWRSCHALDGEYRVGNLSYMLDNTTFMCYLKSDKGTFKLPNFPEDVPWNSKKWRMLMYTNKWKFFMAGRQYPFTCETILDDILTLLPNINNKDYVAWAQVKRDSEDNYEMDINNQKISVQEYVRDYDPDDALHFNDLLHSSCYLPYYTYHKDYNPGWNDEMIVGNDVLCLTCGRDHVSHSDSFFCYDCQEKYNRGGCCACCGSYTFNEISVDFDNTQITNIYLCRHCQEQGVIECPCCEKMVAIEDAYFWSGGPVRCCKECEEKHKKARNKNTRPWEEVLEAFTTDVVADITVEGGLGGINFGPGELRFIPTNPIEQPIRIEYQPPDEYILF